MLKLKNFKKGQVLIIGIIFMALILLFSTTIFSKVSSFINFGAKSTEKKQAIHIAEAGIDLAIKKITDNPNYNPDPTEKTPIGSPPAGEFTVQLNTITPTKKTITVEAFVPNATNPKTKQKAQVNLIPSSQGANTDFDNSYNPDCGLLKNDAVITNNIVYVLGNIDNIPPNCSQSPSYGFTKNPINTTNYTLGPSFNSVGIQYQTLGYVPVVPNEAAVVSSLNNGYIYSLGAVDSSFTGNSGVYFNNNPSYVWTATNTLPNESAGIPNTGGLLSRRGYATVFNPVSQADADGLIVLIGGALGLCPDINNPCQKLSTMLVAEKNPGLGTLHLVGFENKGDINLGHPTWPKWWNSAAVANNNIIYILGGNDTDMVIYTTVAGGDINVAGFIENPNKLPKKISRSSAVVTNGYIFLFGGRENYLDGSGNPAERIIKDVYSAKINADGSLDPFTRILDLVLPVEDFGAAVINNNIYITFGHSFPIPQGSSTEYIKTCWHTVANSDGTINPWKDCHKTTDITYQTTSWSVDRSTFHLK